MALFGKKSNTTNIPELQEYYANQKRESTGVAWLLAVGSLLITAAVIIGLFIGGRWLYRKITNDDSSTVTTTQTTTSNAGASTAPATTTPTTPATPAPSTPAPAPAPTPTPAPKATPAPTPTPAPGVSPNQSASTNSSAVAATTSKNIPDTGAGNTVALFVAIMVVAFAAHRYSTLKKLSR